MLDVEENERLTRVGPGTPGGDLLRRYWHPIHPAIGLADNPVTKVRILGEDLVLFRDRSGGLGLVGERCPHRRTSLACGIPEAEGLRCCYHGWLFDAGGKCLEQPLEPPDSTFKDRVRITAYPVAEMGGLVWAYLGPDPAPFLPRWDLFVRPDGFRQIVAHRLPCNWLQVMENRGDLGHAVFTHGRLFQYVLERQGRLTDDPGARYNATMAEHRAMVERGAYVKYRAVPNEFGFTKGRMLSDESEDQRSWTVGIYPILFPYILASGPGEEGVRIRRSYQIGVPVDDTTTWHFQYFCYVFPPEVEVPAQDRVPYVEVPLVDEDGNYTLDYVLGQDMVAWYHQGEIADRENEHLGVSDRLVIAYRNLLKAQIDIVAGGGEPMNVFRDPALIERPELRIPGNEGVSPLGSTGIRQQLSYREKFHKVSAGGWRYIEDDADRYCPDKDLIIELFERAEKALQARDDSPVTSPG
ncbi:MAG: Rieske 2Fe-2S domain-containing protein [Acidimicrobiia bacterium]